MIEFCGLVGIVGAIAFIIGSIGNYLFCLRGNNYERIHQI